MFYENRLEVPAGGEGELCAENLPLYMVPDLFSFVGALPKTSTGKIDYQALKTVP